MRTIKFRAWDKQYKQLGMVTHLDFITNELDHDKNLSEPKSTEHFELMQFTGLLDKNGKEIYEGDIVKPFTDDGNLAQVIFLNGSFVLATQKKDGSYLIWNYMESEVEIIGNIYENPELLNEVKNG